MLRLRQRWCVGHKAVPAWQMTGNDANKTKTISRGVALCHPGAAVLLLLLLCVLGPQGALSMRTDALLTTTSGEGHLKQDVERPEAPCMAQDGSSNRAGPRSGHADMGHDGSNLRSNRGEAVSVGDASDEVATDSAGAGPYRWVAEMDDSDVLHGDERLGSHSSARRKLKKWFR